MSFFGEVAIRHSGERMEFLKNDYFILLFKKKLKLLFN